MAQFVYPNNINFEISITQMPTTRDYVQLIAQQMMLRIKHMISGDFTAEQLDNIELMVIHCGKSTTRSTSEWLHIVNQWIEWNQMEYDEIIYRMWQSCGGYLNNEKEPEWFDDNSQGDFIRIEESIF